MQSIYKSRHSDNNDDECVVDRSRGTKEDAESIHEDLESLEDGQLFDNQPVKHTFLKILLLNTLIVAFHKSSKELFLGAFR